MDGERRKTVNTFLETSPKLGPDDTFDFICHKGLDCFNECCHDLSLMLTAYDVLRLRRRLGMTSDEFLDTHTTVLWGEVFPLPTVHLKMLGDERRSCPFLTPEGCSVYEDRPWACRMYPLGSATSKNKNQALSKEYFFIVREPHCKGFLQSRQLTVRQWFDEQVIAEYSEKNEFFKDLTMYQNQIAGMDLDARKQKMFFMSCYNLEKFKRFVFKSSFLERFDVDQETLSRISGDETALMLFAFEWLRFSILGQKTMKVKEET
jgi:uncharacterized protein